MDIMQKTFGRHHLGRAIALACAVLALGAGPLPALADEKAEAFFKEARTYLSKGEPRSAIIQLKNALQRDPGHIGARMLLGEIYLRKGDAPAAEKEFRRAADLGAPQERWVLGLGQALLMQQQFQQLLDTLKPDAAQPPKVRSALLAMHAQAMLGIDSKAVGKAEMLYQEALTLDPDNVFARLGHVGLLTLSGKYEEALVDVQAVLKLHPDNTEVLVRKAELHRFLRQFEAAEADFKRAAELNPANARAWLGLGLVQISRNQPDQALASVDRLDKALKDSAPANYIRGLALYQKKEYASAGEKLQLVLRDAPEHLQAQLLYGVVNYAQGNYQLAEDYLARIHSSQPGELMVAKLLAAARMKLKQPARAIEVLERLMAANPKDAQIVALLGSAHLMAGDNNKGAEYMARAVELEPDQALLRTQLAVGKLVAGDTSSAISELEQAVSLGQDLIQADVLLVLTHIKNGAADKAVTVAKDLQVRMPDSPVASNILGLSLLAAKDFDSARKAFQDALKKDAAFLVADMNLARLEAADNKPEQAEKHYLKVLGKQPDHQGAMLGLAALARARGDQAEVEKWVAKANEAAPQSVQPALLQAEILLRKNDTLKALALLNSLSEKDQRHPQVLRLRGMASIQDGKFSNAVHSLKQLTQTSPKYIEGWFQLGRAQAAIGDLASARDSFKRAQELDVENKISLLPRALAELELKAKRWDVAMAYAKQLQLLEPKSASGFELEAAAYRGMGQINRAIDALEKAARVEGSSQRMNLLAHTMASAGKAPKAMYMLQDWLHTHPDDATVRGTLGLLQQQMGLVDEAIASYQQVLEKGEPNPVIFNNLAWLYLKKSDKRAADYARQAYEIAPERAEIVDTYGWVLFSIGEKERGLALLQQALVLAPKNAEISLHVAEALHGNGRDAEARTLLDRIITDHPNTQWALPAKQLREKLKG